MTTFKREKRTNNQIVASVVRATDEPMLKCADCFNSFRTGDTIVIDIGNEVDGILIFHQENKDCIQANNREEELSKYTGGGAVTEEEYDEMISDNSEYY